jgi:hypothetical protein
MRQLEDSLEIKLGVHLGSLCHWIHLFKYIVRFLQCCLHVLYLFIARRHWTSQYIY